MSATGELHELERRGSAPGELKMNRLSALAAVVVTGLGVGLMPAVRADGTNGGPPGVSRHSGVKVIAIAGKRVVVNVSARRNFSMLADPRARLQTAVYLTTTDGSGLPDVRGVKAVLTQGTARWAPVLAKLPDDVQSVDVFVAQGGPLWQVNSAAKARVELKVGHSTYRIDVPVTITASKDVIVQGGW